MIHGPLSMIFTLYWLKLARKQELITVITNDYSQFLNKYTFLVEKSFVVDEVFYEGRIDETVDPADYIKITTKAVRIAWPKSQSHTA